MFFLQDSFLEVNYQTIQDCLLNKSNIDDVVCIFYNQVKNKEG